jgi:hypothetical protein
MLKICPSCKENFKLHFANSGLRFAGLDAVLTKPSNERYAKAYELIGLLIKS